MTAQERRVEMDPVAPRDDWSAEIDALDDSLGQAAEMAAAFNAEMGRVRAAFAGTGQDVATLERGISRGLTRALRGAVVSGDSFSEALDKLAGSMINAAFNSAVKPVTSHVGGLLSQGIGALMEGILPFEKGGTFAQGRVQPFAKGGIVSSPTMFPMRGGGAGLMGEAGPEAIMPLSRGPDGKLGVRTQGAQAAPTIVMNISTPDAQSFQRSRAQIAAQMSRALGHGQRNS
jgi:lambda family phage tail tape measure protein